MNTSAFPLFVSVLLLFGCSSGDDSKGGSSGSGGNVAAGGGGAANAGTQNGGTAGVSGGGGVSGGEAGSAGNRMRNVYEPDDPNIQYSGRVSFNNPKRPRASAPGVSVSARFVGDDFAILMRDQHQGGTGRNYYDVVVDGVVTKLTPELEVLRYDLDVPLEFGEHEVRVIKRTQASIGFMEFRGFEFAGEILPPAEKPVRRVEIIGDSISAGEGAEGATAAQCQQDGWGVPHHNAEVAFGTLVAKELEAEYHVTAVSGIGLVRNYSSRYDARPMPVVYDTLYFEQMSSPAWDPARFVPDAVVIALGTNDFSPGDSPPGAPRAPMDVAVFTDAYIAFLDKLRGYYPEAYFFLLSSPLLDDGFPVGATSGTDIRTALTNVESHFQAAGDERVLKVFVTKVNGRGCTGHPNVMQHEELAAELLPAMRDALGW